MSAWKLKCEYKTGIHNKSNWKTWIGRQISMWSLSRLENFGGLFLAHQHFQLFYPQVHQIPYLELARIIFKIGCIFSNLIWKYKGILVDSSLAFTPSPRIPSVITCDSIAWVVKYVSHQFSCIQLNCLYGLYIFIFVANVSIEMLSWEIVRQMWIYYEISCIVDFEEKWALVSEYVQSAWKCKKNRNKKCKNNKNNKTIGLNASNVFASTKSDQFEKREKKFEKQLKRQHLLDSREAWIECYIFEMVMSPISGILASQTFILVHISYVFFFLLLLLHHH